MTSLNTLAKQIRENLMVDDVMVSRKNGCVRVFKGYFYSNGGSPESFAERVREELKDNNIEGMVVDWGGQWKPFKGGASVRTQSHWYVDVVV